ncbi:MAG: c-type cytochrome [Acidobacteriaceae bacterium]
MSKISAGKNWSMQAVVVGAMSVWVVVGCALFPRASKAADDTRGQAAFEKRCTGCHAMNEDKEGPRLQGLFGRHAGSVSSFHYSDALKNSNVSWEEESLNKWLKDPDSLVPDNDMAFHVSDEKERSDIIAYLKRTSGK